jgi:hypothetical protein
MHGTWGVSGCLLTWRRGLECRAARAGSEPGSETRFEAGDVVVLLGEPDSLAAAEIRLLNGFDAAVFPRTP